MGRMMVEIPIPPKWKQLWDTWDLRCFIVLSLLLQTFLIFAAPLRKRINRIGIIMPLWSAYLLADAAATFAVGLISNSMGNTNGGVNVKKGERNPVENEDLLAFWAPFLLVHLGGPDTITAFALEDNELWLRHLLGLIFQCVAAVYVFVQSLLHNRLWIPTMLMFMTGIMKYSERTRSLYLASADRFKDSMLTKPDPGPNYAKIMDEYTSKKDANLPTRIQMVPEPDRAAKSANKAKKGNLTELEVVQYGYLFFNKFKGLVVDMIFSRRERNQSRDFFLNRTAKDAFKVVEVELNFIYDVLFTKLPVVFDIVGAISRFFSLATVCSAIILFIFKDKKGFSPADVTITYGLLFGALVLDMTALIMLLVSDWTIITLRKSPDDEPGKSMMQKFITVLLRLRTEGRLQDPKETPKDENNGPQLPVSCFRLWTEGRSQDRKETPKDENNGPQLPVSCFRLWIEGRSRDPKDTPQHKNTGPQLPLSCFRLWSKGRSRDPNDTTQKKKIGPELPLSRFLTRRWSETISTYNLIYYCLHPLGKTVKGILELFGLTDLIDGIHFVYTEQCTEKLKEFIFDELKSKSELADDLETAKEISLARGDWVLRVEEGWSSLLNYVVDVDYDQSLILWHIATELCYNSDIFDEDKRSSETKVNDDKRNSETEVDEDKRNSEIKVDEDKCNKRKIAKNLSDYMLYLLIMQPNMMSAVAGIGEIRFRDTCAEARRFFEEGEVGEEIKKQDQTNRAQSNGLDWKQIKACMAILSVSTEVQPVTVKGDRSKSLLFDGCILAKELKKIEEENKDKLDKWSILSKVWVELLCYAASHSRANTQAAQVSKGGELITIVWLLMTHFGLGDQFQINEGQARAKLIVGK